MAAADDEELLLAAQLHDLRWELECCVSTNVGLAAGLYSGISRPDLNLTPHALHRVLGPRGPVRHCGVFSDAQCVHRRTPASMPTSAPAGPGLFLPRLPPPEPFGLAVPDGLFEDGKSDDEHDDDGDDWDGGRGTRSATRRRPRPSRATSCYGRGQAPP